MIDFHTHIYPPSLAGRAISNAIVKRDFETDGTMEGQIRLMEKYGVKSCAALCFPNRPDEAQNVNSFALSIVEQYSGRVVPFCGVHPFSDRAVEEVEELYELGVRGIKFHPGRQHFYIDDEKCRPVLKKIGELGMVTNIHCGRSVYSKDFWTEPFRIMKVIDCFCGSPVICSHMGGMFTSHSEKQLLAPLPVYVDTAMSMRHLTQEEFNMACELFGPDRIIFGTDLPWAIFQDELSFVESAGFSESEKSRILELNAEKVVLCMNSIK